MRKCSTHRAAPLRSARRFAQVALFAAFVVAAISCGNDAGETHCATPVRTGSVTLPGDTYIHEEFAGCCDGAGESFSPAR